MTVLEVSENCEPLSVASRSLRKGACLGYAASVATEAEKRSDTETTLLETSFEVFGSGLRDWVLIFTFRHPPTTTPQPAVWPLSHFLGSSAPSAQRASTTGTVAHVFDITLTSFLRGNLFWLHELCPQNGLHCIYPAHHGSRYI